MILTGHFGTNVELIAACAKLYLRSGDKVLDLTFGHGVFWKGVELGKVKFTALDLVPRKDVGRKVFRADFRKLPAWVEGGQGVVVLDPPYMHGGATVKKSISKCYGNKKTKYASHAAIIELYRGGMREALRVLKQGGFLWVKCQDEIESGKQRWSHVEILEEARKLGFYAKDLFVLVQKTIPVRRVDYQLHARKNHSYLWVFQKRGR